MKKLFMLLLTVSALVFTSCGTDPCEGKSAADICNNNGTLADKGGDCGCDCDAGYTGSDCSVEVSGNYSSVDKVEGNGQSPYFPTVTIVGSVVTITNFTPYFFGGATKTVTGTISGNTITVPATNGGVNGGGTIGGTGVITNSGAVVTITWSGTATISNTPLAWTGVWTK